MNERLKLLAESVVLIWNKVVSNKLNITLRMREERNQFFSPMSRTLLFARRSDHWYRKQLIFFLVMIIWDMRCFIPALEEIITALILSCEDGMVSRTIISPMFFFFPDAECHSLTITIAHQEKKLCYQIDISSSDISKHVTNHPNISLLTPTFVHNGTSYCQESQ